MPVKEEYIFSHSLFMLIRSKFCKKLHFSAKPRSGEMIHNRRFSEA